MKESDILLIGTNYLLEEFGKNIEINFDVGLLSIASMLEKYNYKTKIIDLSALVKRGRLKINKKFHQSVAEFIIQKNPRFIGFSTRCDTYPMIINIAKRCKRIVPECKVILGGPQATFTDIDTLREFPFIDVIVRGEGEITIVELMRKLEDKGKLEDVDGITYRENGKIIRNKDREPIKDLDSLPLPAYHLIEEHLPSSKEHNSQYMYINVGRGCRYRCKFCSLGGVLPRMRTPKFIFKEIKLLKEKYGFKRFSLDANSFLSHKEKAKQVCNLLIKEKLNIKWKVFCRIDSIDIDSIRIMSEAGCEGIFFGIESGSSSIQKFIKKRLNFSLVRNVLSQCKKYHILPELSFVIGFPVEREEDLNATINLALKIFQFTDYYLIVNHFIPWGGVPLANKMHQLLFNNKAVQNDTNGCYLQPTIRLRENRNLIRRHPTIFNYFYVISLRYLSMKVIYEVGTMFCNIVHNYPLSFSLALKELRLTPVELRNNFKAWLKKKGIKWDDDFANFRQESRYKGKINKAFPNFIKYLYRYRKTSSEFLSSILYLEKKKFDLYSSIVNSKSFLTKL